MTTRFLLAAGALALAFSRTAWAAEPRDLPADTKWVLNLDLKAAQAAPMVGYAVGKIAPGKRRDAQAKLAAIKALFGVDLLKDIREVVIAGSGLAQSGGVAYIYADFDTERLTTILAGNSTFASAEQSGFKLLSWTDDNDKKQKFGSFVRPGLTVISDRRECLVEALEVLAGKRGCLPPGSPLKPALAHAPQDILCLMAVDVPSLVGEQPKAQALRQAQSLCLRVHGAQAETLSASLSVTATSAETAVQLRQALLGIQALCLLRAAEAPEQAAVAQLAKITGEGATVGVTLDVPKSVVEDALRQRAARAAAQAAPAPAPGGAAPAAAPGVLTPVN